MKEKAELVLVEKPVFNLSLSVLTSGTELVLDTCTKPFWNLCTLGMVQCKEDRASLTLNSYLTNFQSGNAAEKG